MRDKGHNVFIDVNSITIGDPWVRSIEKNISDCDIFVVILTPDSLSSPHVEREVLQAQEENKIIVPCIHEHVDYSEIKWGLEENQGIEFYDKYELALNLYPKIKNYTKKENENPSPIPKQKTIQDTDISEDVDVLNKKSIVLKNQDNYQENQEIIKCYDARVNLNNANALNNKGIALYNQGKYQETIEYFDKALRTYQYHPNALNNKGNALYKQGKYQEAIEYFDKALTLTEADNPCSNILLEGITKPGYIFNSKGNALYKQRKYQEAIKWYDQALRIDPNHANALNNKGLALGHLGKYHEAIEYFDKALRIDPDNIRAQDNKILAHEWLSKEKT
jgi:tetratricopeptide (TPR) repeat protein